MSQTDAQPGTSAVPWCCPNCQRQFRATREGKVRGELDVSAEGSATFFGFATPSLGISASLASCRLPESPTSIPIHEEKHPMIPKLLHRFSTRSTSVASASGPDERCRADSWTQRRRAMSVAAALALATAVGGPDGAIRAQGGCAAADNPIACENLKPGDPASQWDVSGAGDPSIQGFATEISVVRGQIQRFKIRTTSNNYVIDLYRMGYYGGSGARRVATISPSASLPQTQPNCLNNSATGLIDCGNWGVSASWTVPPDAVSGIYFAKLRRIDTGGSSHLVFVVRDDTGQSDLLFQTSDTTWQAYNSFGGNSLYVGSPAGRAYKVSYNRPFNTRLNSPEDWVFNAEYPMVRWLEANGYNVSYSTGVDSDRLGAELLEHKVFLSVGHDEYWSGVQRANVEAARAAGVHLAFFSGNEVFWKTRWESSIDGSGTPYRTLVSYKETHANAKIDPNPAWTGTWRDPRFSPPADGGRPENALTGTMFEVNSGTGSIRVPSAQGKHRFWRSTTIANLAAGASATLPAGTLGYEWDEAPNDAFTPQGLMRLSLTTMNAEILLDYGSTYGSGPATHSLTLYRHASGALVFGAGTVQWTWGLDANHDRGSTAADARMKQATVNLFADMGVQPDTLEFGLVPATASSDLTPPSSTISSPTSGQSFAAGTPITISGTASDAGGGIVAGVEVSVNGGTTWERATGTTSWTFAWTVSGTSSATIKSRAFDDSGNNEPPSAGVTITVTSGGAACPCTIWSPSAVPPDPDDDDPSAVEVGTRFRADADGHITGVRFYKAPLNTGTHVGKLWTRTGTLLASVTFTGETASGWQQANFASPVPIAANTTYVVSYHAPNGHYTGTDGFFATALDRPPLHGLRDGVDGPNGVYRYGASAFPTDTYFSEGYWVDVVFLPGGDTTDTTPPAITSVSPTPGSSGVQTGASATATFNEAMTAASIDSSSFLLRDPSNALVSAAVTYNSGTRTATLTPSSALAASTQYTAVVRGGTVDPRVKDSAGNAMAADYTWSFTTAGSPQPSLTISDGEVTEGNTGVTNAVFNVTMSSVSAATVTVAFATANGTATAGSDFTATSGSLTFAPGATTRSITVPVLSDALNEADELFSVNLSGATNASIAKAQGAMMVVNDDPVPSLSIADGSVTEGDTGTIAATLAIGLSTASGQVVTVGYATAGGTATAGSDFTATSGTITFAPGVVSQTITVTVRGDVTDEPGETVLVNLSNPVRATIARSQATLTILDDDLPSFTDTTVADFTAGVPDASTYIGDTSGGDLMLTPTVGAEFSGTALPADWTSTVWGTGGVTTVGGGNLVVNGTRVGTTATYGPGRSLEFVATFTGAANQNVGFGVDFSTQPWAAFGTTTSGALRVRSRAASSQTNTTIAGSWVGGPHLFRIDWNASTIVFFIDGVQVASHARSITAQMRPLASDRTVGGQSVTVNWMRMTPHATAATFLSRVFDAGSIVPWADASWTSVLPSGTSLIVSVRTGNTPAVDGSWTSFATIPASGASIGASSRYLQYRLQLATSVADRTPTVMDVTVGYNRF
jgi:hypothetical protein